MPIIESTLKRLVIKSGSTTLTSIETVAKLPFNGSFCFGVLSRQKQR
jgi:hypothetical protein